MFRDINRNNRLFMLSNFLFALSYGLWMNLRQLYLGDLGATPVQIGSIFGVIALAGGILPLPAGILSDRIGPKYVIIGGWSFALLGTLIAALANSWLFASVGFAVFMLVIAANPTSASYILLNTREGSVERVMTTVYASWPVAMVGAPALGGLLADVLDIRAVLWVGVVGFGLAMAVFSRADNSQSLEQKQSGDGHVPIRNRQFVLLVLCYPLVLIVLNVGYVLAPTYLDEVRHLSKSAIGIMFSLFSIGTLLFRSVVIRYRPRLSFVILVTANWISMLILWQTSASFWIGAAFLSMGAQSTMWVLMMSLIGQSVTGQNRGVALGIAETLGFIAIALASWMAGQLYGQNSAHDLPLIAALITMPMMILLWMFIPLNPRSAESETSPLPAPELVPDVLE